MNQMSRTRLVVLSAHALDAASRVEIIALCEAAYGEDFSRWFDEMPGSMHVLARDEAGALASHAAWVPRQLQAGDGPLLRTAYVEAVATHPARQGRGLGTAVMEEVARTLRADLAWKLAALSPSLPTFYARLDWELWQGPLGIRVNGRIEPSPDDEQVMILRLLRTPPTLDVTTRLTAEWRVGELW